MNTNPYLEPALWRKRALPDRATWWSSVRADEALEFGRFRVLLRRQQLLADGIPVELGTRAFDLLLVLLEAAGAVVTKEELLRRVWRGIVVSEENLQARSRSPMIYAVAVARVDRSTNWSMENVLRFGASYRHEYRSYPLTCAVFGPLSNDRKGASPAGNIDGHEGRLDAARAAFGKLPRCGSRMIRAAEGGVGRRKRPCSASTLRKSLHIAPSGTGAASPARSAR
jgi:hypothetical protein